MRAATVAFIALAGVGLAACPAPQHVRVFNQTGERISTHRSWFGIPAGGTAQLNWTVVYDTVWVRAGRCEARYNPDFRWRRDDVTRRAYIQIEPDLTIFVLPSATRTPLSDEALAALPPQNRIEPLTKVCE